MVLIFSYGNLMSQNNQKLNTGKNYFRKSNSVSLKATVKNSSFVGLINNIFARSFKIQFCFHRYFQNFDQLEMPKVMFMYMMLLYFRNYFFDSFQLHFSSNCQTTSLKFSNSYQIRNIMLFSSQRNFDWLNVILLHLVLVEILFHLCPNLPTGLLAVRSQWTTSIACKVTRETFSKNFSLNSYSQGLNFSKV